MGLKKAGKVFVIGLAVLFLSIFNASAEEISAKSKIVSVTVFSDHALITRRASLNLKPGEYTVVFDDLKPHIDENSLRVSASGVKGITLFGATLEKKFLQDTPSENIQQLQQKIELLRDERRVQTDIKAALLDEKQFLDSIRLFYKSQFPQDIVVKTPSATELKDIFVFLQEGLDQYFLRSLEADRKIRLIDKELGSLESELSKIGGASNKTIRLIKADVSLKTEGRFDLDISYLARGASWRPVYDARAGFEDMSVELVSYALVKQTTGEDWQDVSVTLSTARPNVAGRLPYVASWILRPYQYPSESRTRHVSKAMIADAFQSMAFEKDEELGVGRAGAVAADTAYTQAEEKGTAVSYVLPRKETILSDAAEHKLPVSSQKLAADYKYSAYPKESNFAYLGSRVRNSNDIQLLAGPVNIFLDNDFVGSSSIDNVGPGEEFDLYLGVDENVKIKREQISKKIDETMLAGIPSPNKRIDLTFKLNVENYKQKPIIVHLFESMPVSEDDKIKVKQNKVSVEPKQKDWQDRKGVWLWELNLAPGKKQEITYSFSVEHGRNINVPGL